MKVEEPYLDIKQNPILGELRYTIIDIFYISDLIMLYFLGQSFADISRSRYKWIVNTDATTASTDFVRSPLDAFICFLNLLVYFELQGNISHGEFLILIFQKSTTIKRSYISESHLQLSQLYILCMVKLFLNFFFNSVEY